MTRCPRVEKTSNIPKSLVSTFIADHCLHFLQFQRCNFRARVTISMILD